MFSHFKLGRAALVVSLLFLAAPAVAAADGGPALLIGPVKVHHRYVLSSTGNGCGTKYAFADLAFTKTITSGDEAHTFGDTNSKPTCHIAGNLSSGSLKFDLPGGLAKIDVTFHKKGAKKHEPVPKGCTGKDLVQPGIATGTFDEKVDGSFFGKVHLTKVPAEISDAAETCSAKASAGFRSLFGSWYLAGANDNLDVFRPKKGAPTLSAYIGTPAMSNGMYANHSLTISGGNSLFQLASNLGSATIKAPGGSVTGSLKFTATSAASTSCGVTSRNGTLSGKLAFHFDLIGTQVLRGAQASSASVSKDSGTGC